MKAKLLAVKSGLFVNLAIAIASVPVAFARLPLARDVANAKASLLAVEMRWSIKVEKAEAKVAEIGAPFAWRVKHYIPRPG